MEPEAIRDRLIKIRRDKEWTMEELGRALGTSKNAVFLIEKGRKGKKNFPKIELLNAWLKVGGVRLQIRDVNAGELDEATGLLDRSELALVLRLARALPRVRGRTMLTSLLEQLLRVFESDGN